MSKIEFTPYLSKNVTQISSPEFDISPIFNNRKTKPPVIINPLPSNDPVEEIVPEVVEEVTTKEPSKSKRYQKGEERTFINDMTQAYTKALVTRGMDPQYAKYLAVQDALESAYGKSYAGNWNFGNITVGSSGASYTVGADTDGNGKSISQKFRNYNSLNDYINNKIDLLSGNRYKAFTGNVSDVYNRIKAGGYATAKDYVDILTRMYRQWAKHGAKLQAGGQIQKQVTLVERIPESYQKQFNLGSNEYEFRNWYNAVARTHNLSLNPDDPEHHYDWRGYFNDNKYKVEYSHFPDKYKLPGHETFSVESKYYKPGMMAGHWEDETYIPTPFSDNDMEARQHYAESRFKANQQSKAGAKGAYQITDETWKEIDKDGVLDPYNYDDNKFVRDAYMQKLREREWISKAKRPIQDAMVTAAYNMGPLAFLRFLNNEINNGIDVYETWDWIDDLNSETKNYVNFIVRGIDGPADLTNAEFKKALPNRFKNYVRRN